MIHDLVKFFRGGVEEVKDEPSEGMVKMRGHKVPVRHIQTSRGGMNAPKYQPCPECNKGSRRTLKSGGVAYYRCPRHGEFSVSLIRP